MSIEQAEPMAIAKGMSAAEFAKLKDRVKNGGINTAAGANKTVAVSARDASASDKPDTEKYNEASAKPLIDPQIFGSELYTSVAPSFEPNMSLATPLNCSERVWCSRIQWRINSKPRRQCKYP